MKLEPKIVVAVAAALSVPMLVGWCAKPERAHAETITFPNAPTAIPLEECSDTWRGVEV